MPWSKTEGADTQQVHEQLFDEQVARTKHDYKLSTAKDPVFNSTRIWKVEDHCRKEHRCGCARTDRSLSMLEQNLMHLSMLSRRGGRPGVGGGFDVTSLPVAGTFDHSSSPGGRDFWL